MDSTNPVFVSINSKLIHATTIPDIYLHYMANIPETFTAFLEGWLQRQQNFLEQLLSLSSTFDNTTTTTNKDDECRKLVQQVLDHYMQYYQEKSIAANDDVFLLYSPPWFSTFERTFLWMSGFKPSLVFRFLTISVGDSLSAEQLQKIDTIKAETRKEEREIEEIMARIQESVAAPPLFNLVRLVGRLVDREVSDLDSAMEELKREMQMVTEKADRLRGTVVGKVMEILSPEDRVKLLAGAAEFQLQTRRLGLQRDQAMAAATTTSNNV